VTESTKGKRRRKPSNKALNDAKAKAKAEAEKAAKAEAAKQAKGKTTSEDAERILSLFDEEERTEMLQMLALRDIYTTVAKLIAKAGLEVHDPIILFEDGDYIDPANFDAETDEDDEDEDDEDADDDDEAEADPDDIIVQLSEYMEANGKSQGWAARKFKVSQATVSNWLGEKGTRPRANTLAKIERFIERYA
jgi:transposase